MGNNTLSVGLTLKNQLSELEKITTFIEGLASEWLLTPEHVMTFNLVLEEAFTNIVNYGYSDINSHTIELFFEKNDNIIRISLKDDGIPYDPTKKEDPDLTSGADERAVGGLGIYLIKTMMDTVAYQRVNKFNYLYMEKYIGS